ncbi:hypothetical protein [Clostridioides difficile]|uniref:hypothetical protein n=1 Tax=Clostridioides difficile TaxID=1496 RepID=UPI002F41EB86
MNRLERILMPLAEKIGKNKLLIAIRDGFLVSSPLLIIGSLFLLVANFPIKGWNEFAKHNNRSIPRYVCDIWWSR